MKTPSNPSQKAMKRVKDPLPIPTSCNCCQRDNGTDGCIISVENKKVYGKNYGEWPWIYLCDNCGAYVGMHPFTNIPLGTLADESTRTARKLCKVPFEKLYKKGAMTRSQAYSELAKKLDIPVESCHFGWFDAGMCRMAAIASRVLYEENCTS